MSRRREVDKLALVSEEAAEWFLRLKDDRLALSEQREYLRWLRSSPCNIGEALRVGQVYSLLTKVKLAPSEIQERASNVVELESRPTCAPSQAAGRVAQRRWGWAMAAALGAVTLVGLIVVVQQLGGFGRAIETEASEWRHFTLADGSKVSAGPRTRLRIEFSDTRRLIYQPRGEALFSVQKDPMRPFYVDAGLAVVRAVGTQFAVVREEDRVLVTVQEGLVAVSQTPDAPGILRAPSQVGSESSASERRAVESVAVSAGQQAAVPRAGHLTVEPVNVTTETAWAYGRLIFEHQTVAQAVEAFNRRNRLQIAVEPQIATLAVFGVFDAADPESFAQVIAREAPATIVRDVPGLIKLQRLEYSAATAVTPSAVAR